MACYTLKNGFASDFPRTESFLEDAYSCAPASFKTKFAWSYVSIDSRTRITTIGPMPTRDQRASNLLSRLFSYAPRPGRDALEDYCTEALAWCLRESPHFLTSFLRLTGIPELKDWTGQAEVRTQVRSTVSDLEEDDEAAGSRFDLVIESGLASPFVVVIESKVSSDFGPTQLPAYRMKLKAPDAFPGIPERSRFLVTLTATRPAPSSQTTSILWPEVHRALIDPYLSNDPLVRGIAGQFAGFLEEKGLSMLELTNANRDTLNQWVAVKDLEAQMTRILERLRIQDEVRSIVGRRQVRPSGKEWIGVAGKNGFWAGFVVLDGGKRLDLVMWVEITIPGDRRSWIPKFTPQQMDAFTEARRCLQILSERNDTALNLGTLADGNSRFVFAKIVDGESQSDGEGAFQWLHEMSTFAISLVDAPVPG